MPELPEVEVVVRSLGDFLLGQKITDIELRREKSLPQGLSLVKKRALGQTITAITRRAKFIQISLSNDFQILTHLKMTGQLIYVGGNTAKRETAGGGHPTADWIRQLPGKHTRTIWTLADNRELRVNKLYFNDQRVFGWMKVLSLEEIERDYYSKLGPDANSEEFTVAYLQPKLAKKSIAIKTAIMDNAIVCGLGNIYAAETCWAIGLDPRTPAKLVSTGKLTELVEQSKKILAQAIKAGGTTFDGKYVDAEGKSGNYSEELHVYGHAGQKCERCEAILENVKLGGRATVFCPSCQK